MSRTSTMTIGFLMVFIGLQMNFVETYVLSPVATKFLAERFEEPNPLAAIGNSNGTDYGTSNFSNPFSQASFPTGANSKLFSGQFGLAQNIQAKRITPSDWLCWPLIFIGAAFVLHGAAVQRGS